MTRWTERVLGLTALLLVVAVILGCGAVGKVREAAARAERANRLKAIGLAYYNYLAAQNRSPSRPADLQPFLADSPEAWQALNAGEFTVVWDADFDAMQKGQGMSAYVLGYESS